MITMMIIMIMIMIMTQMILIPLIVICLFFLKLSVEVKIRNHTSKSLVFCNLDAELRIRDAFRASGTRASTRASSSWQRPRVQIFRKLIGSVWFGSENVFVSGSTRFGLRSLPACACPWDPGAPASVGVGGPSRAPTELGQRVASHSELHK